jgi:hypothetical protein
MNRFQSICFVALFLATLAGSATAAEFARSPNFMILADERELAEAVLARAEQYRREIAVEWLGEPLPEGIGAAMINVRLTSDEDNALTWPTDPASQRQFHRVWLNGTRQQVTGPVLKHELTHVVLATWLPQRLAPWADEGVASRYDDANRAAQRRQAVQWFVRTGDWPRLERVLNAETITADDAASYAIAASLADFLLERGNRATLLRFAVDGGSRGWDAALESHYGLADVADLQTAWQDWASERSAAGQ